MPASIKHLRQMFAQDGAPMLLFARWDADNLYYQVKLLKLDEKNFKATVRYEDGTEVKVKNTSLHIQFSTTEFPYQSEDEIVCCICEGGDSEDPNNLILCDVCQQGYHQDCHDPKVPAKDIESEWACSTCDYMLKQLVPKMIGASTPKPRPKGAKKASPLRVALKPIKAPKRRPTLPVGASIDGGCDEVIEAAKALIQTEDFMNNLTEQEPESEPEKVTEKVAEKEKAAEKVIEKVPKSQEVELEGEEKEQVKEQDKKKKTIKGKLTKSKKIPQPA